MPDYSKTSIRPIEIRKTLPSYGNRPSATDDDRENVNKLEGIMRVLGAQEQSERSSQFGSPGMADASHDKMQALAEEAMRQRRMKHFAEGGVLAPTAPDPQPSAWQQLWSKLMGKEALSKAAGTATPSTPPQNQDISIVRQAAKEAGERMEADKAAKEASKSKYGGYGK